MGRCAHRTDIRPIGVCVDYGWKKLAEKIKNVIFTVKTCAGRAFSESSDEFTTKHFTRSQVQYIVIGLFAQFVQRAHFESTKVV